ncbi:MAG: family 78 glycoside hydrolase catalytic domain [Eubacteriales bacterium]|nr:family 78 glycoside hydrolase catalytic domain [Eubacteriales bacterium]
MEIRRMQTNHLTNPMGYSMEHPSLSWITEGKSCQKAARIQVSLQSDFSAMVYDSGARADLSSLGFCLPLALRPRTRYFWRVEVESIDGERALSEAAWFETAKMEEPWTARWVAAPMEEHPVLFKQFTLEQQPVRARIYTVGLGLYELALNGENPTDEVLTPFYNDYETWIQYQTFDVTHLLRLGDNQLDMLLGNGWYKGRFGLNELSGNLYGSQMQMLLELHLTYADGKEEIIASDESWLCRPGPVLASSIYDGEVYDERLAQSSQPVKNAILAEAPQGQPTARLSPPLRVCDRLPAKKLIHTPAGEWVIDFEQEMTGWVEFDCDLPAGREVHLKYGEILQNDCFYRENLRSAKAAYTFVSAGQPAHVRPRFTFFGFRYILVEGIEEIRLQDFTGCVVHSDLPVTGRLETSNAKLNRLVQNAYWGALGNFVDVPTDCPQRDERLGWTGDAHVFTPTASFFMDTASFYNKFLSDMLAEQKKLNGSVPFVVPDVLDRCKRLLGQPEGEHGSCAWGDAATGIPWTLYLHYGDTAMLKQQFNNMRLWTDWIWAQDEAHGGARLWNSGFHFADWLALDNPIAGSCFGGTDPYYVASAYYYYSASLTAKAAGALGLANEQAKYVRLAAEVKTAFQKEFFTSTGRVAERTQTAMALALCLELVPQASHARLARDLGQRIAQRSNHLDTGFVGTYFLLKALTQNGMNDLAYTLLLNEDYPSWLYEVNMGATTIWERWNSVLPDGKISDTGMNSLNHYAYGSIVEWMETQMCGLKASESAPGFRQAVFAPHPDERLEWARCEFDSASGRYACGWKHTQEGMEYELRVPFGCQADFVLPVSSQTLLLNGAPTNIKDGRLTLKPGEYRILCPAK